MTHRRLRKFASDIHSQNGEDGILAELLRRLGISDGGFCVEFGAWDGRHLSNTFALVERHGWRAVYIEADAVRFEDLRRTATDHIRIRPVHAAVGVRPHERMLDDILDDENAPIDLDVCSIDIDSHDLDVWASLRRYRPKVVVIETNAAIPPGVIQWHDDAFGRLGNSFSAALAVARYKGYTLVCHTLNAFFVADELVDAVGLDEFDRAFPERLFCWDWVQRPLTVENVSYRVRRLLPDLLRRSRRPH